MLKSLLLLGVLAGSGNCCFHSWRIKSDRGGQCYRECLMVSGSTHSTVSLDDCMQTCPDVEMVCQ